MAPWLSIAMRADVARRAYKVALVVGTILVTINHWDRFIPYTLDSVAWIKIAMTYCVPYCVSTYSAVGAIMAAENT